MSFFPMPTSDRRGDYALFTDETSITASTFMVIGGVLCRTDTANEIAEDVKKLKFTSGLPDSFQWKHINARKVPLYRDFIDMVLEHIQEKRLDFGCIVLRRSHINHRKFNGGDMEVGFSKFLYQVALKFARGYSNQCKIKYYHGYRESSEPLETLRGALNSACFNEFMQLGSWPVQFPEAKYAHVSDCELLQIADVFIGAVGHAWNGRAEIHPASPKTKIAAYLDTGCPTHSLAAATYYSSQHFWIWPFRLQGGA